MWNIFDLKEISCIRYLLHDNKFLTVKSDSGRTNIIVAIKGNVFVFTPFTKISKWKKKKVKNQK